mmetsp:Transcript_37736/g.79856  ORF Transcript_37736/g.79856 Transcript_37736/m.79856 type:complete len:80 (-) Transcript_37736:254-493(-)
MHRRCGSIVPPVPWTKLSVSAILALRVVTRDAKVWCLPLIHLSSATAASPEPVVMLDSECLAPSPPLPPLHCAALHCTV